MKHPIITNWHYFQIGGGWRVAFGFWRVWPFVTMSFYMVGGGR